MPENEGLDLKEHYQKIRKVVEVEYGDGPIETDDLVQQVCHKILKMNGTSSAYDEEKASVGRYVRMIAQSIISGHVRKKSYQNEHPYDPSQPDVPDPVEPDFQIDTDEVDSGKFSQFLRKELPWEDTKPRRVFLLMRMGYKRSEIAEILSETPRNISWYRTRLKNLLDEYASRYHKEV